MAFKSRLKCLFFKPIFCILFATFLHFARNTTVSDNDEKILKDLMDDGFDVFTQMVPSDKRVNTKDLLK